MALGVRQRVREDDKNLPTRYYSDKQEKRIAKAVGGQQTPNSGAASIKGDVLTNDGSYQASWLLEAKTKTKNSDSITIRREWFEKNRYEASEMGKANTAIVINFGPDAPYNENYYIINETLFKILQDHLKTSD